MNTLLLTEGGNASVVQYPPKLFHLYVYWRVGGVCRTTDYYRPPIISAIRPGQCFYQYAVNPETCQGSGIVPYMIESNPRVVYIQAEGNKRKVKRVEFEAELIECVGCVFDRQGLTVAFFRYKGKNYEARKENGWQPVTPTFWPRNPAIAVDKEVAQRLAWIVQTHLLPN